MTSLTEYLADGRKNCLDLQMLVAIALAGSVGVFVLPAGHWLRVILGLPLVIFFPGYALVSALWPRAPASDAPGSPDAMERLALGFGLSLAVMGILGLILNYTGGNIDLMPVVASDLGVTMGLAVLAYALRMRLPDDERFGISIALACPLKKMDRNEKIFAAVLVIALVLAGATSAYMLLTPVPGEEFTEFYILDANGTADDYPVNLSAGEMGSVIVGIDSHEARTVNYTILVSLDNATGQVTYGDWNQPIALLPTGTIARNVTLGPGESFEAPMDFYIASAGTYKMVWQLLMDGQEADYEVHMWVEVR